MNYLFIKATIMTIALLLPSQTLKTAPEQEITPNLMPDTTIVQMIDKLAMCESGDRADALNPSDGGSRSVGRLQFKDSTFAHYSKRYGLTGDIWNGEDQTYLAYKMIEEDYNNLHHWEQCSTKNKLIQ